MVQRPRSLEPAREVGPRVARPLPQAARRAGPSQNPTTRTVTECHVYPTERHHPPPWVGNREPTPRWRRSAWRSPLGGPGSATADYYIEEGCPRATPSRGY